MSRATITGNLHAGYIHPRRTKRLCQLLQEFIPVGAQVLDVGCGDGLISSRLASLVPGVRMTGCDVLLRPESFIPVQRFDGKHLPFASGEFDVVLLVDVLHHAEDADALLREAARVSRRRVLLKDHVRVGWLSGPTLRLMDWFGNAYTNVALPYRYWTENEWKAHIRAAGLRQLSWVSKLDLYPWPLSVLFDRSLHVLTLLEAAE